MSAVEAIIEIKETAEASDLTKAGVGYVEIAKGIIITEPDHYQRAGEGLMEIKVYRSKVEAAFALPIKAAHEAHKRILALRKDIEQPLIDAEIIIKDKMSAYTVAQEKIREEEERKRRKTAEAEERARREAEAAEMKRKAAEDAKAAKSKAEAERIKREAAAEARALKAEPIVVAPVQVESNVPKVAGVSTRKTFAFRITDPDKITRGFMLPNEPAIGALVRKMGKQAEGIVGGIEVYEKVEVAAGRR